MSARERTLTGGVARHLSTSDTAYLLGRPHSISYSDNARALVDGNRFLITGAGGSIGSEIMVLRDRNFGFIRLQRGEELRQMWRSRRVLVGARQRARSAA